MKKLMLALLICTPILAQAGEVQCLSQTMYAESRGEPLEGAIAVGQATVNRAKKVGKNICALTGVERKAVPKVLSNHFNALAKSIINGSGSVVGNADSWNTGRRTAYPGAVKRRIGKHIFYAMVGL